MPASNPAVSFYFLLWIGEGLKNKLLVPVIAQNDTKAAPEKALKRIRCNCNGELCTFFQHATAYSEQLGLE